MVQKGLLRAGFVAMALAGPLGAQPVSILGETTFLRDSGALPGALRVAARGLFTEPAPLGLFAPLPPRSDAADMAGLPPGLYPAERLRHLIARAEAGAAGYDAVIRSADRPPPRRPSVMTLAEIRAWIADTPGQNHAIGRYQLIPKTLDHVASALNLPETAVYSPRLQDRIADFLLEEAGYSSFLAGQISRQRFMNNLARIWAGLPNSSGKSHYAGIAGNKAVITWAQFDAAMADIFAG